MACPVRPGGGGQLAGLDYAGIFDARGHDYNAAGEACPGAREAERAALLERAALDRAQRVLDVPAGGGYVAHGVRDRAAAAEIICVEPSRRFGACLHGHFHVRHEAPEQVALPDGHVDRVLSLAGLHHLAVRQPVYREWARLLRPGGRVVVADVAEDTAPGEFLNGFVNEFTPGGHNGVFISADEFTAGLSAAGLQVLADELLDVPWDFADLAELGEFCWQLFSCRGATPDQVARALADTVGVSAAPDGRVRLHWQLRYAVAVRPSGQSG